MLNMSAFLSMTHTYTLMSLKIMLNNFVKFNLQRGIMLPTRQGRIEILTSSEIDELYQRPEFSQTEREEYFALDDSTRALLRTMGKIETRVYFILFIGYFRAKPTIPKVHLKEAKEDVSYICKTYFSGARPQFITLAKGTRSKLLNKVLSLLGFKKLVNVSQGNLTTRLQDVATICTDPRYMFDECLAFFSQKRIALPGYTSIQTLITQALSAERHRTELILSKQMSVQTTERLLHILNNKGLLNNFTGYKGSARDFSPSELDRELHTNQEIKDIYPELKMLLNSLKLSRGNVVYYASIVKHCSIQRIRRAPKWQGLLYLVCYLYFRYRDTNDKLVTAFCYLVRKHADATRASANKQIAEELEVIRDKLKYAGSVLSLFVDDKLNDNTSFGEVRKQAFDLIPENDIQMISQHLDKRDFDRVAYQWQYTDKQSRKIANSLRKLFIAIDIEGASDQNVLSNQIVTAKEELDKKYGLKTTDQRLIRLNDRPYLMEGEETNTKRFEYYLYHRIIKMLEKGKIYVSESERNKRLEDDLIPTEIWQKDKQALIEKTGLARLAIPISQTLAELELKFNTQLERVTASINADANEFVKRQPRSNRLTWSLANKRWKSNPDNPIYSQSQHLGIIEIMNYVNQQTGYLSAFEGISSRKRNTQASEDDLIACIFGNGANYGLHRIASVSDRSIGSLRTVNDAYIRPETTSAANDLISNAIAKLPIFKYYTINETAPFGSVDGQKHGCRINTFKARFSAKYFRKGKGVSAMTLVVNHVPVNAAVNAPNEYEGHFAFDLLYNNSSDIHPGSLATDNHGTNSVNFAILDIFGYQFAPRYAKFKKIFEELFEVTLGEDLELALKTPINTKLIEQEWERIQHIKCSLSRKATNQSTVIKKLASDKRNSRTLDALREYDRLIKCLYILQYVDNQTLRQFVQQALNRGEAYHQLRRAIASVNGNQFRGGNDYQIDQWNDCARLIANCIIYYNSALLSGLVQKYEAEGNQKVIDILANLSPVAWTHIQLAGNYTFAEQRETFSLKNMLEDIDPLLGIELEDEELAA